MNLITLSPHKWAEGVDNILAETGVVGSSDRRFRELDGECTSIIGERGFVHGPVPTGLSEPLPSVLKSNCNDRLLGATPGCVGRSPRREDNDTERFRRARGTLGVGDEIETGAEERVT